MIAGFGQVHWAQIGNLIGLQVTPNAFLRIELRRVWRQKGQHDATMLCGQPLLNLSAFVRNESVPDNQQRLAYLALERVEERNDVITGECSIDESEVKALLRQRGNHRYLTPSETLAQHRRVSLGRPGARHRASLGESRFADEEDDASLAPGLF